MFLKIFYHTSNLISISYPKFAADLLGLRIPSHIEGIHFATPPAPCIPTTHGVGEATGLNSNNTSLLSWGQWQSVQAGWGLAGKPSLCLSASPYAGVERWVIKLPKNQPVHLSSLSANSPFPMWHPYGSALSEIGRVTVSHPPPITTTADF